MCEMKLQQQNKKTVTTAKPTLKSHEHNHAWMCLQGSAAIMVRLLATVLERGRDDLYKFSVSVFVVHNTMHIKMFPVCSVSVSWPWVQMCVHSCNRWTKSLALALILQVQGCNLLLLYWSVTDSSRPCHEPDWNLSIWVVNHLCSISSEASEASQFAHNKVPPWRSGWCLLLNLSIVPHLLIFLIRVDMQRRVKRCTVQW